MDNAELIKLVQEEGIGPAEVIALRRAVCGFVVRSDGTEERLQNACEWMRLPGDEPTFKPGSVYGKTSRIIGRALAKKKQKIWCERCNCPLASKTTIGFDPATRQPWLYERLRCPLKQW